MRKTMMFAAAVAGAAFTAVPAAAAELITNGGFEAGAFTGWTVTGSGTSGVASNSGTSLSPATYGSYRAFFRDGTVTLSQTIATVVGQTYIFGFTDELDSGSSSSSFSASFGGVTLFSRSNTGSVGFTPRSYSVTATSASTLVSFSFASTGAFQNFDNVTVSGPAAAAVPEPASWAMMIGGFGMIGGALRRRHRPAVSFG